MIKNQDNCAEYARISRRRFLGASAAAGAASLAMPQMAFSKGGGTSRPALVGIFLRGAMDGISAVVPYGDAELYGIGMNPGPRPGLAITPPGTPNGAVDLDGYFGLNPNASALLTPFAAGNLAVIHAAGSTDPSRSHFEAMRTMETGTPDNPGSNEPSGWLARHLQSVLPSGGGALRGISIDDLVPRVLALAPQVLPIPDPGNFAFPGRPASAQDRRAAIEDAYGAAPAPLGPAAASSLAAIDELEAIDFVGYVPANGAVYPTSPFGTALRGAATLIKANIGLEALHYDYGGWDHHNNQGPVTGTMANMLLDLSAALEAFHLDLLGMEDKYVLYAKSEFGRRVAQNGSAGTDHGSGGVMFAMGHRVQGGLVHGTWPTLSPGQLDNGDLAVTTDYRDVLTEILQIALGGTDLPYVFNGFTHTPLGVVL